MWQVSENDVIHLRDIPGGDSLTDFVDSLIFAEAYVKGLPLSEIRTTKQTNLPDGGVDTEVRQSMPKDDTGFFKDSPTIWQYKAKRYHARKDGKDLKKETKNELRSEIQKTYSSECIKKGYAYRLCICDNITADICNMIEEFLTNEAQKINPNAPNAKVLSAGILAKWASNFPAIVLHFFYQGIASKVQGLEAWGKSIKELTPKFLYFPDTELITRSIHNYIDFSNDISDSMLTVHGFAGVGKTRLVYESLASYENARLLAVYASGNQNACDLCRLLSNTPNLKAILIADNCDASARNSLDEIIRGHKDRVRIIAIDDSGEYAISSESDLYVRKIPKDIQEKILEENYPEIPIERRRAYIDLSDGFIGFSAYFSRNDRKIAAARCIEQPISYIRRYLESKISPQDLKIIKALSLFTKVGFEGDLLQQLSSLCEMIEDDPQNFKEIAKRLHDGPGFISRAGRYYYVTPEIIAQVGFDSAWNDWVEENPQNFLEKLPKELLEPFLSRVKKNASDAARRKVGEVFRRWSNELSSTRLASAETVNRLVTLIEVEPETYFFVLLRLIEQASNEELKEMTFGGINSPRHSLIRLAERIATFPTYFDDAETILFRFGLAESETKGWKNATSVWKQLFRIFLSGTAVPFSDRLNRLEKRIFFDDKEVSCFAMEAFEDMLDGFASRTSEPSTFAGKLLPAEYVPNSTEKYNECMHEIFLLLRRIIVSDIHDDIKQKALSVLIDNTRSLIYRGHLEDIKCILLGVKLSVSLRINLLNSIKKFLQFDTRAKWGNPALPEYYVTKVREWLADLKPSDFKGRLEVLVGTYSGYYRIIDKQDELESEVKSLALESLLDPEKLMHERNVIFSPNAKNAFNFGHGLGNLDSKAIFLNFVIKSSIINNITEFGRGYISGLLDSYSQYSNLVNNELDEIQMDHPALAYELFTARIELTQAVDRTIRLVDLGKLDASYLGRFSFGKGMDPLSLDDFDSILIRLVNAAENGNSSALRAGLEFVSFRIFNENDGGSIEPILEQDNIRSLSWKLIEISPKESKSYEWIKIIEALSRFDPDRAARIAALTLVDGSTYHLGEFMAFFKTLAESNPKLVMQRIGEVVLDENVGWKFHVYGFRSLFKALPDEVIVDWVKQHGVKSARLLARHLPVPYISDDGVSTVPFITKYILEAFEDDNDVFNGFVWGVHANQGYSGDIASQHDKEAEIARKFLNHSSKRIREWAQMEEKNALSNAKRERQFAAEMKLN